jgi:hypothetical protein
MYSSLVYIAEKRIDCSKGTSFVLLENGFYDYCFHCPVCRHAGTLNSKPNRTVEVFRVTKRTGARRLHSQ